METTIWRDIACSRIPGIQLSHIFPETRMCIYIISRSIVCEYVYVAKKKTRRHADTSAMDQMTDSQGVWKA